MDIWRSFIDQKDKPQTILVIKNRAMGDAVIGLSTIQYLKKLYPESKLIYATPSWVAPLFSKVKTPADLIIPFKLNSIIDWLKSYFQILSLRPDIILELFQSGRTKKFFSLGPWKYMAHDHHQRKGDIHDQGVIKSNIQRDLDGAWTFLGKNYSEQPPSFLNFSPEMKINVEKEQSIILGVVATRETKMWSLKNYAHLTKLITNDYPKVKIWIPLSPSLADQKIKKELLNSACSKQVEFIELPLDQLPLKLSKARLYIGNDTGLKHICVAIGVKTWTFFGPEPPLEWHPYDSQKHPYFYLENLACRTKDAHYCGLQTCSMMDCLKIFSPENVWERIKREESFNLDI